MPNTLYYGDNLDILRQHVPDESVDLIYLDPPFNSNASYNVLFKEQSGEESSAQIKAFHRHVGVDPGVRARLRARDHHEPDDSAQRQGHDHGLP